MITFKDVFRKSFLEGYAASGLTVKSIVITLSIACLFALYVFVVYRMYTRKTFYSKSFNISLAALTLITTSIILTIQSSIVVSLGMVGALSIVRFRTAVKDSRDTVYIFWTVIAGICCGVGDYMVAAIGSAVTFFVILVLGCIKNDNRMLLIIRAARNRQSVIQAHIFKIFKRKAILRVRNTTEDTVELIYEISSGLLRKVEKENVNVTDSIYEIGGIEYVNLVMQNDEISN